MSRVQNNRGHHNDAPADRPPAPWVQIPVWVLAAAPGEACRLYGILAAHLWYYRDSDVPAWPTREELAALMGFKQPSTIDKLLRALVEIGALDIVRNIDEKGRTLRNTYVLHKEPPEGYDRPIWLNEVYRNQGLDASSLVARSRPAAEPTSNETNGTARQDQAAAKRDQANRSRPAAEPTSNETNGTGSPSPAGVATVNGTTRGFDIDALLDKATGTDYGFDVDAVVDEVHAIRPDWSKTNIRKAITSPAVLEKPRHLIRHAAVLVASDPDTMSPGRIAAEGDWWTRAAEQSTRITRDMIPHCGECDPKTRQIWDPVSDTVSRCPACHPTVVVERMTVEGRTEQQLRLQAAAKSRASARHPAPLATSPRNRWMERD